MPVEIKELVIRAVATREQGSAEKSNSAVPANTANASLSLAEREVLIQAAVSEVFRILGEVKER